MTPEEKAKAYDEAIEDMRVIYPNLKGDTKLAVEHAFPKLAESKDERTMEWFQKKVKELRDSLAKTTKEYIESNKQYNNGDILKISFTKGEKKFVYKCMIVNIYLKSDMEFMSTMHWPTPTILYFARNCWKNEDGVIEVGGHCPLGYLEGSGNICGHIGIDMNTLKIEVININEL